MHSANLFVQSTFRSLTRGNIFYPHFEGMFPTTSMRRTSLIDQQNSRHAPLRTSGSGHQAEAGSEQEQAAPQGAGQEKQPPASVSEKGQQAEGSASLRAPATGPRSQVQA